MRNQGRNRVVVETASDRHRRVHTSGGPGRSRPREGLVAISVIAAATFATFIALFLTSRPFDPMNSSLEAQTAVPPGSVVMQTSPTPTPTPTPAPTQTQSAGTPEPAGSTQPPPPPDDAAIQAQIEKAMASSGLAQLDVSTIVEGGNVTIVGSVLSAELKQRVERTIKAVSGVQSVTNQLVVIEPTPQQ